MDQQLNNFLNPNYFSDSSCRFTNDLEYLFEPTRNDLKVESLPMIDGK